MLRFGQLYDDLTATSGDAYAEMLALAVSTLAVEQEGGTEIDWAAPPVGYLLSVCTGLGYAHKDNHGTWQNGPAPLRPECQFCAKSAVEPDGYCSDCGKKQLTHCKCGATDWWERDESYLCGSCMTIR